VGYFGTGVPTATVGVSGAVQSGDVSFSYQVSDPDSSYVFLEFEVSIAGTPFKAVRQAASSPPTFAVATSPAGGQAYTFVWDSRADTTPGLALNCVIRVRAVDGQEGPWSTSAQFTVSN
jgi:hypothetical protein